nr:hypothetical protein [Desulfuromonadales bacterium]
AAGTVVTAKHPGAKIVVQGQLTARGTKAAPIRFATPEGWQGIHFMESRQDNLLEYVHFDGFATAISCLAASPTIRHGRFGA